MTSYRQIEANRRNALKSTGPRTEAGKQQSRRSDWVSPDPRADSHNRVEKIETIPVSGMKSNDSVTEFARCFLRLANLSNFALDRLGRYEASLWRQTGQVRYALDALDRRKPQERTRRFSLGDGRVTQQGRHAR
jgi:hypothetical protein